MFEKPLHAVIAALCVSFGSVWIFGYLGQSLETGLYGMYAFLILRFGVSFALGGAIAGKAFVIPAVTSVFLVLSGIVIHTAYLAAQVNLPMVPILLNNLPVVGSAVLGALIGAILGSRLKNTTHGMLGPAR